MEQLRRNSEIQEQRQRLGIMERTLRHTRITGIEVGTALTSRRILTAREAMIDVEVMIVLEIMTVGKTIDHGEMTKKVIA
ncbi:hypothetical protein FRX31_014354 [Thalictrum thalictroides]|uniref:Uncharacterized protein n=1 Tax=Thalictrum thalictroides TaxID=46969 RepID=A0A7J6WF59_THATH|nr:hypothetical protein FRX31_014354 [Thalictrum thalictroides]